MKNIIHLLIVILLIFSSCKKDSYTNATVIKNCTGTYLKVLDQTYQICNANKTSSFENEQKVLARFTFTKACSNDAPISATCYMLYYSDGWINIIDLKKL